MFSKLLIANRGEIAVRIIKTARALGYRTVAVYSEADSDAPHVDLADEAVCIGPASAAQSYLNSERLLEAARLTGADAIHPGYGFLSENAGFAQACVEAGRVFIGPPVAAIELMGSKGRAKTAMQQADVPCVPGYQGSDQSDATLLSEARRLGLPVMIKASAGGGGRGMRLVQHEDELLASIKTARSEALSAFGDGELILEKAIIDPRHIEIQVFADQHGQCIYLGERDCSIQRRHQKVVEEAPSPFVSPALRQRMGEAAVQAARSCGYVGAGTVEFLVDANEHFYFLEMNTRLQVEHPVTELITGTDLVAWQLQVAAGKPLPMTQAQLCLTGHAMEVRLYAEDPAQGFLPQTGTIIDWQPAPGEGVRIDSGIVAGQQVSPHYDPMLAKIIAWGADREEARRRLVRTLEDSRLFGVTVNARFLRNLISHPAFIAGAATTGFINGPFAGDPSLSPAQPRSLDWALASVVLHLGSLKTNTLNWRRPQPLPWAYKLRQAEVSATVALYETAEGLEVQLDDQRLTLAQLKQTPLEPGGTPAARGQLSFTLGTHRQHAQYLRHLDQVYLQVQGRSLCFTDLTYQAAASSDTQGAGRLVAPMDGAIVELLTEVGAEVKKGQTLVILEAMKMEHQLKADCDAVVAKIPVVKGQQVKIRQPLVQLTPHGTAD